MEKEINKIKCPNCGHYFLVEDAFFQQAEEKIKKEYEQRVSQQIESINKQKNEIANEREKINKLKEEQKQIISELLEKEKAKLKADSEKIIREEFELKMRSLQEENEKRKKENKELKVKEVELLKKENELKERQEEMQLELDKKILENRDKIANEIRKKEHEKNELKFKEYEKKLEDQKNLIEEMQRKAEQGSMQLQGEVQELAIEDWLKNKFSLDTITEIKKGARGADCLQTINTRTKQNCGTIYYESKRTKDFHKSWIEKFKNDIRDKSANIGVLVTDAMPSDMERMGLIDGIWVCSFEEFKGLCFVLRESVIQISNALVAQENKGEKMSMLYDFLTSNEFRLQIEAIVEGFTQMQTDLETEKRSLMGHWKKREKQIQKVLLNTNYMYNSIKGIAGNAIQTVKALELNEPKQLEE